MEEVEEVKNRLEPFGYTCRISEDADKVLLTCSPKPEALDRDKINRIELLFPKREDLVAIEILTPPEYAFSPNVIKKSVQEWIEIPPHLLYEAYLTGVEFKNGARKYASAIVADIIRERRKPFVLQKRRIV